MVYRGHIKNGAVVLDEDVALPEGAEVSVEVHDKTDSSNEDLRTMLLKHAGTLKGFPPDFSLHHDHYIHGTPKE